MIIVSARSNFDNAEVLSTDGHHIRQVDLNGDGSSANEKDGATPSDALTINKQALIEKIAGKKILVLVHGFNNEQLEVYDAYQVINNKINQVLPHTYDYVIGYSWPGGKYGHDWWGAKSRANSVARMFRALLETLGKSALHLDLMSHSLGARVCMKALKETPVSSLARNYFCMAPAINNECLEANEEFVNSIPSCGRIFIFHSSHDGVLRVTYNSAEKNRALGLHGPEDQEYISHQSETIYVANCKKHVASHGGYKRSDAIYQYMKKYQTANPNKFKTI